MILRRGARSAVLEEDGPHRVRSERLADAGGLRDFGLHIHTLEPGWTASSAHWHAEQDELLYVLEGEVTVVEDGDAVVLGPGDAACWPRGVAVAHRVENRASCACRYVICGSRTARDTVTYPELGRTLHVGGGRWRLVDRDGTVLGEGVDD